MADEKLEIAIKAVNEASRALKDVQKDLGGLDDASKKASGGIGKLSDSAKKAAAVGLGALEGALIFSVKAAIEAEQVMAKTEAVIKSTGGAAGFTADEVSDLAGQFSNLSGIDDELIQSAENVLLTFTSIGRDVFPQAMEAALNMSVALRTDLQGAVIMVGKALQDPVTGLTALRRAGVNVNTEMKNTVKAMVAMGDVAGAQAFILKELETEFGGVAKAAGDTLAGKLGKAEVAIGNLAEKIGGALVPVIGEAADAALNLITMTERINDVFDEHEEQIRATSDGYAAYQTELFRSAVVVGQLTQGQLDYIEAGIETQETVDRITIGLGGLTEAAFNADRGMQGMNARADEGVRALAAMAQTTEEEAIPSEEELAEKADEAAKKIAEQEKAMRLARDAAGDAAEGFFGLAQAYVDGMTTMDLVKTALDEIDKAQRSGLITDDERRAAQEKIMLQFDLVTTASLSQARAQEELGRLYQLGRIDEDTYLEGLLLIPSAAEDGRVSMGELGGAVADASAKLGEAEDKARRASDAINNIPKRTDILVVTTFETIGQPPPVNVTPGTPTRRQFGGPVFAGQSVAVHPPELFFPQQSGFIMSQADTRHMLSLLETIAGGMGRSNITVNAGGAGAASIADSLDAELARRARAARQSGAAGLGRA